MARVSLPTLLGVPIRVSWPWIVVIVALSGVTYLQLAPLSGTAGELAAWTAGAAVLLTGAITSLILHDLAHIVLARRSGSSLNAIEPTIAGALPDTCYTPEDPVRDAQIAIAGPLTSLALTLLFGAIWIVIGQPTTMPGVFIALLAAFNAGVVITGLLPGYPFDGGRLLRSFLWFLTDDLVRATRIVAMYGQGFLFVGLIAGVVLLSLGETYAIWGAWVLVLCWALNRARSEGMTQTAWHEAGRTLQIDDLFQAGVNRVPATSSIDASIESLLDNFRRGPTLVVNDHGEVIGVADLKSIRRVPRAEWTQVTINNAMTSAHDLPRVQSRDSVSHLLEVLPAGSTDIVLVERDGRVVAAADREFVVRRVASYVRADGFHPRRPH